MRIRHALMFPSSANRLNAGTDSMAHIERSQIQECFPHFAALNAGYGSRTPPKAEGPVARPCCSFLTVAAALAGRTVGPAPARAAGVGPEDHRPARPAGSRGHPVTVRPAR